MSDIAARLILVENGSNGQPATAFHSLILMIRFFRAIIPLLILAACGAVAWWIVNNQPKPEIIEVPPTLVRVEGTRLRTTSHTVKVRTQGSVQPRTSSTLLPEVTAKIVEISPAFRPGGFFEKDEVLLRLDPVDYETAVVVARATVAQADALLAEEAAKAEQARESWTALGRTGKPNDLALRLPQLSKARADAEAARAQVLKAERDLERTVLRAPYAGQVLEQSVDVGQLVTQGTVLGRVFAVDYVEIRLPLPEREMRFLKLPEHFRGTPANATTEPHAAVKLKATVYGAPSVWNGRIVRVEGALDEVTRQITAVAQVDDPYARQADGRPPLRIGQFVEAEIEGAKLNDVFIIPRSAVRAGNEIIIISPENRLRRMNVEPLAADEKQIVIAAKSPKSPKEGEVLCLTPIPFPADGARVLPVIDGQAGEKPQVATKTAAKKDQASNLAK
jgi:RND family efflux transporter MFP subunit